MSGTDFEALLDECLAAMTAGESMEACLVRHPADADALRPLLSLAAELEALPRLEQRLEAIQAGQARMLAAFRGRKQMRAASSLPFSSLAGRIREFFLPEKGLQSRHVLRFAVALLLALFIGTNVAVVASAGSLPGDPLYGVKRTWEEARLTLAWREQDREQLLEQFVERRQHEVREMVQQGRQGTLDLEGVVRAVGDGRCSVDGLTLVLSEQTVIDGQLQPGVIARVRAQVRNDGTLVALRIRTRSRLLPPTAKEPRETPNDMPNGRPTLTQTPTPQRSPEPSRSPQATRTPPPSETPEPAGAREADHAPASTETSEPSYTPGPTGTGEDDHTPEPAETRESNDTPRPTRTRDADHTPEPSETREADHTPGPTRTDEGDHTPEPTRTHEPDHTPRPTAEPGHTPEPTEAPEHTPEPTGELEHTPEPTSEPRHTPEPTDEPEHTPEPTGELEHTPEPTGEHHTPEPPGGPERTPESEGEIGAHLIASSRCPFSAALSAACLG